MSLPTNPLASLVAEAQTLVSQASNEAGSLAASASNEFQKLDLDKTIAELSDFASANADKLPETFNSLGSEVSSAMKGVGTQIQSLPGLDVNSLQETTGAISNITADIRGTLDKLGASDLAGGLTGALGAISNAAGQLNNLLSLKRGANLPGGAELFQQSGNATNVRVDWRNDWRVRISTNWENFNSKWFSLLENTGGMVFPYLPTVQISTQANYNTMDLTHNNYPLYAYKNSQVNDITISGDFTAETEADAAYWIASNLFLKTATKMFFGQGENAGNPPIICTLNGYGASVFNNVPVIVKTYNVELNGDTNYVKCDYMGANTWVPIKSSISVTVTPIYNRENLRRFNLKDYSRGGLVGYL